MRYQLPRGYRRYLLGLAMLALLCIAAAVTVFFVPVQKQQPQAQYLLKDKAPLVSFRLSRRRALLWMKACQALPKATV